MTNWLKQFLEIKDDPIVTVKISEPLRSEEEKMAIKMTGIYTRKPDIEFTDVQAMQRAYALANMAPFTINSDPAIIAEYLDIYGQDEAANLKAGNMVQNTQARFVKGGVWIPPDPKPPEPVPLEGETVVANPFGTKIVPVASIPVGSWTEDRLRAFMLGVLAEALGVKR